MTVQRSALNDPSSYAPQIVFASELGVGLRDIRLSASWLDTATRELPDGAVEISILLRREVVATGRNEATITLETDDPLRPSEVVRVRAIVEAEVIPTPVRLFLRPGESATIEVHSRDGAELAVAHVASDSPELSVSVHENRVVVSRGESPDPAGPSGPVVATTAGGEVCEIPVIFLK